MCILLMAFTLQGFAEEIITNPSREDGFGGQFQTIIYSCIYAELNNQPFRYTPITNMEHNYDNDPDFIKKKEQLINFIGNFEINEDLSLQKTKDVHFFINFFDNNMGSCVNGSSLKRIKEIFRSNKKNYFNCEHLNIAVHIRRPNPHDSRLEGADTPDSVYLRIIHLLRELYASENPLIHIYSQGDIEAFKNTFGADDVVFHIDESIEQTFTAMVFADVLVTSRSSFSYVAGILSEGVVYYIPFWHPPLPHWRNAQ